MRNVRETKCQRVKFPTSGNREERVVEGVTELHDFQHLKVFRKKLFRKVNLRKKTAMYKGTKMNSNNHNDKKFKVIASKQNCKKLVENRWSICHFHTKKGKERENPSYVYINVNENCHINEFYVT